VEAASVVRKRTVQECSNSCGTRTLKRADVRQIDVGNVRNITQVIGQHKAPTFIEIHSTLAVLAANIADNTNNFTSECTCQKQSEHSWKQRQRTDLPERGVHLSFNRRTLHKPHTLERPDV